MTISPRSAPFPYPYRAPASQYGECIPGSRSIVTTILYRDFFSIPGKSREIYSTVYELYTLYRTLNVDTVLI